MNIAEYESVRNEVTENMEEEEYLNLIRHILNKGDYRMDRTKVGTLAVFGASLRFSLSDNKIPLLTTKKVFYRAVIVELLWFIRGDTDGLNLIKEKVNIWKGNGSKEELEKRKLPYREHDLGPVYGFQWRHFGAKYVSASKDYKGEGIDQIRQLEKSLVEDPYGRRHIFTAWNVTDLDKMALPPCHIFGQFFVTSDKKLSLQYYQRSCDVGLGVPFNILSYSILLIMMASVTGYRLGDVIFVGGDVHIYSNHIEALTEQVKRKPKPFPTLKIKEGIKRNHMDEFKYEDFIIEGYNPYPTIKMEMAV